MRLARFVLVNPVGDNPEPVAFWPQGLDVRPGDSVIVCERGSIDPPWYVQGTFDEVVAEINAALNWEPGARLDEAIAAMVRPRGELLEAGDES